MLIYLYLVTPDLEDGGGGGVLLYIDYTGMCRCTGYGFQAFLSRTGYRKKCILGQEQGVKLKVTVQFETKGSGQNEIFTHMDRSEVKL